MPRCSKCKQEKEQMRSPKTCEGCATTALNYYYANKEKQAKNNKLWRTKESSKEKQRTANKKWRENNRDKWLESARSYSVRNNTKPSYRLNKAKRDAKSRNLAFSITLEEYINLIDQPCHYCNDAFGHVTKGTGLDRINSSEGYLATNVVSCCTACNRIKSDLFTVEETKIAVRAILNYRFQISSGGPTQS